MIQINHVKKAIGGHVIFDDLSMQIADRVFFVGVFNAAKGKNLMHYYRHEVGFLFQNFALVERKTVAENLGMIRKDARSSLSMADALPLPVWQSKHLPVLRRKGVRRIGL